MPDPRQPAIERPESKAAAIRDLARQDLPQAEIAQRLGVSLNFIRSSLSRDRKEGRMPVIRQLKPEAGETLELRQTDPDGLLVPSDALRRLGVEPGEPVVFVQLSGEIRLLSPEAAAERLRRL